MPPVGEGYRFHVTGLTHDERGYSATQAEAHEWLVKRLCEKIRRHARAIVRYEEELTEDAEVVLVAYGCTARSAYRAIQLARERGIKVGLFRPITLWPFPEERMAQLAQKAEVVVAELNMGQMAREVERIIHKPVVRVNHPGGTILRPELILEGIMEAAS
jgi:2-oxoglutarate ferredoxin oxidoreductase subunit alpha